MPVGADRMASCRCPYLRFQCQMLPLERSIPLIIRSDAFMFQFAFKDTTRSLMRMSGVLIRRKAANADVNELDRVFPRGCKE